MTSLNLTTQPAETASRRAGRAWLILALPPLIFLLLIVGASIVYGSQLGNQPEAIATAVQDATPVLLVIAQVLMLISLLWALRIDGKSLRDLRWQGDQPWGQDALIGAGLGIATGLLYIFALSPALTWFQNTFGDYVPAGELLTTLGSGILAFFIADVLLAPFVEETIYRGYAFEKLAGRFSPWISFAIVTVFFGLLHWTGGFWYILLTAIVAGGLFGGLRMWRGGLVAPFTAHLALNLTEFLLVWLVVSH